MQPNNDSNTIYNSQDIQMPFNRLVQEDVKYLYLYVIEYY